MSIPMLADAPLKLSFYWEGEGLAWMIPDVDRCFPDAAPDDMEHADQSALMIWEDGLPLGPTHSPHTEIRSLGRGRLSHWGRYVLFSTSDNSNPIVNGRRYEIGDGSRRIQLRSTLAADSTDTHRLSPRLEALRQRASEVDSWFRHDLGHRWRLRLAGLAEEHAVAGPTAATSVAVLEDGVPLTFCDDPQAVLEGGGRFAVVAGDLLLSAGDGSNPKLNGCSYVVVLDGVHRPVPASVQALILGPPPAVPADLAGLARAAMECGLDIPLEPLWWVPGRPSPRRNTDAYYHFLAGMVRHTGARRILEIGTEHGGSAYALMTGLPDADGMVVTLDLVDKTSGMPTSASLTRLLGDAAHPHMVCQVLELFGPQPIDILFVDSAHVYGETLTHFSLYCTMLRPRLVLFDDIVLCESMARFWADLRVRYGASTVNVSDVLPDARSPDAGLGLLDLRRRWE